MDLPLGFEQEYSFERQKIKVFDSELGERIEPTGCWRCRQNYSRCVNIIESRFVQYRKLYVCCVEIDKKRVREMTVIHVDTKDINIKETERGLYQDEKLTLRSVQLDTLMKMRRIILNDHKRVRAAMWKLHRCQTNQQKPFILYHQSTR